MKIVVLLLILPALMACYGFDTKADFKQCQINCNSDVRACLEHEKLGCSKPYKECLSKGISNFVTCISSVNNIQTNIVAKCFIKYCDDLIVN